MKPKAYILSLQFPCRVFSAPEAFILLPMTGNLPLRETEVLIYVPSMIFRVNQVKDPCEICVRIFGQNLPGNGTSANIFEKKYVPHPVFWTQDFLKPPWRVKPGRAIEPWPARG